MRKPQGYGVIFDPLPRAGQASVQEFDTLTCAHCNKVVHVKPGTGATVYLYSYIDPAGQVAWKEKPGAFCRMCMKGVCLRCEAKGVCTPLERQIEQMEARGRLLAAVASSVGV
jgi:hypothetical protein